MDIGTFVPQAFYDLIGRVLPGSLMLLSAAGLFLDHGKIRELVVASASSTTFPTTLVVLAAVGTSYMLGALVGGFAVWIEDKGMARRSKPRSHDFIRAQLPPDAASPARVEGGEAEARTPGQVALMYDFVQR